MRFSLDKAEFFSLLSARGFQYLFHTSTVETGLSYFSLNSLSSREFIEYSGLPRTSHPTDQSDKKLGMWNDLFLSFHDHHWRLNRPNSSGPLCFRVKLFEVEKLLLTSDATISVCKKNPEKWQATDKVEDRWVKDVTELESLFREPMTEGERRGFFKDGLSPNIVMGNLATIPLHAVDKVLVEQNPTLPGHYDSLQSLIKLVWPKQYYRQSLVVKRGNCPDHCACKKVETYQPNLQNGFAFNAWERRFPQLFPGKQKQA